MTSPRPRFRVHRSLIGSVFVLTAWPLFMLCIVVAESSARLSGWAVAAMLALERGVDRVSAWVRSA